MSCELLPSFVGIESTTEMSLVEDPRARDSRVHHPQSDILGTEWGLFPKEQPSSVSQKPFHKLELKASNLGSVVTTENQVFVYDARSRRSIYAWTVRPGPMSSFTTCAVGVPGTDALVVVQHSNKLLRWACHNGKIADGAKATVSKTITKLLVHKHIPGHFIAVHEDCSVGLYTLQLREIAKWAPKKSAASRVVHVDVVSRNRNLFVFMVSQTPKSESYTMQFIKLQSNGGSEEVKSFAFEKFASHVLGDEIVEANATLTSVTCQSRVSATHDYSVALQWSNGCVQFVSFPNKGTNEWCSAPPSLVNKVVLASARGASVPSPKKKVKRSARKGASAKSDDTSLAASGKHSQLLAIGDVYFLVAQTEQRSVKLMVWDSRYGVVMTQLQFPLQQQLQNGAQVQALGNSSIVSLVRSRFSNAFMFATEDGAFAFEIRCPKPTLAAALGKMQETNQIVAPNADSTASSQVLVASVNMVDCIPSLASGNQVEAWESFVNSCNEEEEAAIAKLSSDADTPTEQSFDKVFFEYINKKKSTKPVGQLRKKRGRSSSVASVASVASTSENLAKFATLSQTFTSAVVNRCCKDEFWSPLEWLLEKGVISFNVLPDLLPTLLEKQQLSLVYLCLRNVPDISEKALVDCIMFACSSDVDATALAEFEGAFIHPMPPSTDDDDDEQAGKKAGKSNKKQTTSQQTSADKKRTRESDDDILEAFLNKVYKTLWAGLDDEKIAVLKLILAVCSAPQNDVFLKKQLKRLSIEQVELVLGCLARLLANFDLCPRRQKPAYLVDELGAKMEAIGVCLPDRVQAISWICSLLDSHFQQLVLSSLNNEELKSLLARVQDLVVREKRLCEVMSSLSQPLAYMLKGNQLIVQTSKPNYTIEKIAL